MTSWRIRPPQSCASYSHHMRKASQRRSRRVSQFAGAASDPDDEQDTENRSTPSSRTRDSYVYIRKRRPTTTTSTKSGRARRASRDAIASARRPRRAAVELVSELKYEPSTHQEARVPTHRIRFTDPKLSNPMTIGKTLCQTAHRFHELTLRARQMLFQKLCEECDSEEINIMIVTVFPKTRPTDELYIKALDKVTQWFNAWRKQTLVAADELLEQFGVQKLRNNTEYKQFRNRFRLFANKENVTMIFWWADKAIRRYSRGAKDCRLYVFCLVVSNTGFARIRLEDEYDKRYALYNRDHAKRVLLGIQKQQDSPKLPAQVAPLRSIANVSHGKTRLILDLNGNHEYAVEGILYTKDDEESRNYDSTYDGEPENVWDNNNGYSSDSGFEEEFVRDDFAGSDAGSERDSGYESE